MDNRHSNSALGSQLHDRVKLNVGGKLFETTVSTIQSGGPDSLLAALSARPTDDDNPVFIDRDPEIFSILLSLLRTNRLPSTSRRFSKQELADEALYYGIESQLKSAISPPPFNGIDASVVATIRPAADGLPSAFTAAAGDSDGSVWIAHGGQISGYDWNLTHAGTIRTHLEEITSIRRVWPEVAAVGSENAAGLHFYDFSGGRHVGSAHWTDQSDPRIYKARVTAIADSDTSVFASFECRHKENCILLIDKSTLQISSELSRQNGSSAKTMVAGKITYLPQPGVLLTSAVTSGAFGYSGYIRIWDPRSGEIVWETIEPGSGRSSRFGDSFADVDVDADESTLFKVCSKSGDLGMADLRNLGDDPWVYLKDKNPSMRNTGGADNCVVHCYRNQVFLGREGGLEVWSKVEEREGEDTERESRVCEGSYRRNYVDKVADSERGIIKRIEGGGDRLFVSREDVEGIEALSFLAMSPPPVLSKAAGYCSAYQSDCIGNGSLVLYMLVLIAVDLSDHMTSLESFMAVQPEDQTLFVQIDLERTLPWQFPDIFAAVLLPIIRGITLRYIKPWSVWFGILAIWMVVATLLMSGSYSYKNARVQGSPFLCSESLWPLLPRYSTVLHGMLISMCLISTCSGAWTKLPLYCQPKL